MHEERCSQVFFKKYRSYFCNEFYTRRMTHVDWLQEHFLKLLLTHFQLKYVKPGGKSQILSIVYWKIIKKRRYFVNWTQQWLFKRFRLLMASRNFILTVAPNRWYSYLQQRQWNFFPPPSPPYIIISSFFPASS